jgi:splicing factor 3B subunit 2
LPDFIEATGIAEIRDNKKKSLKIQARERMNPKLGKLDIDYQILHDAFFKYQKKSKLTNFGELYYEGREYEIKLKHLQPGKLTDRLKKALGMPTNENDVPPPWLINMQQVRVFHLISSMDLLLPIQI